MQRLVNISKFIDKVDNYDWAIHRNGNLNE